MTDSRIQPGAFVRRRDRFGVGKVMAVDGNPSVLFWANRGAGRTDKIPEELLTPLSDDSPEALLWERPKQLDSWATERPLQLVALALSLDGGAGKVSDIRDKLEDRVPLGSSWDNWWKKRTKAISNLPTHFETVKASKGNEYRLLSSVGEVPPDWTAPKRKPATRADWERWLTADSDEPPPGRYPPKQVCDALSKWNRRDVDRVQARTVRGAEEFLLSEKQPPKQAAAAWMDAVSLASARQRQCGNQDFLDDNAGKLLKELARITGRDQVLRILADALSAPEGYAAQLVELRQSLSYAQASHASKTESLRQTHAADMEHAMQSHAAELERLRQSHAAELERERQQEERLRQQVQALDSELNAQREESRLEARQDMLLAVGEVLQSLWRRESVEELAGNVEAGLALALQAGGADLLEKGGETVEFNPQRHQAKDWLPESAMVKVLAPGVIVRGGAHGDRVLLKAHVRHEAG